MTDAEKSKILAEMVGWKYERIKHPEADFGWVDENGKVLWADNSMWYSKEFSLYEEENMAYAWRVLNWAMREELLGRLVIGNEKIPLTNWYVEQDLECKPPAVAQRAWLDKIIELTDLREMEKQDKYNEAYMSMWKAGESGNAKRD